MFRGKIALVNDNNNIAWYAAGLHFECLKCGRCCSGPAEGYIWISRPEIRLIARHLNVPASELKRKFLKRVGLRKTIIEDARTRDCVFLRENGGGKVCSIYPVRPKQCRSWPFWPGNLTCPDSWNTAGLKCPGINRGECHTPEQVQAKNSETWWKPVLRSSSNEGRYSILSGKIFSEVRNAGNEATAEDGDVTSI